MTAPLKAARESRAPAWAATRDAAILELLYGSGLRLSELVALDVTNLDLLDETVRVLGKGQKERIVPVGRPALKAIHAYRIQAHVREGPLFLNKRRTRISGHSVERMLQKYLSATSIKLQVSPHTLRHCFATRLLDNSADLVSVQSMLGHEKLSTTGIYTHVSMDRSRKAYDKCQVTRLKGSSPW